MGYISPTGNNADLIFSGAYTVPLWDEANLEFYEAGELKQIWLGEEYIFSATTDGLDVYEVGSGGKLAYIVYSDGFNTVWGNEEFVFMGTSSSGVKYISQTSVSGSTSLTINISHILYDFNTYPYTLTSECIKYIHGNNETLMLVTGSGIDVLDYGFQGFHSYTLVSGVEKCFITSDSKAYYILNDNGTYSLNRVDNYKCDWVDPSYSYVTGSGIFDSGLSLNDMFVTEGTSTNGVSNCLFVATSSGVYVIDGYDDSFDIYDNSILNSDSNNFTAIWADYNASLTSGKFYVSSTNSFNVVNINSSTLYDCYTSDVGGRANTSLNNDGIVDINVA